MRNLLNWIVIGFLGYKAWEKVSGDISQLQDWDYRIKDIFFSGITANRIQGMVVWDFINKSSQAGGAKDIMIDIFYQDRMIGSVSAPGPFQVPGNGSAEIRTAFSLDLGAVGSKAMKMLQDLATGKDIPLFLQGSARVRAGSGFFVKLPIQIQTTAKTIYLYFN